MKKLLTEDDLTKIVTFFSEEFPDYDLSNIEIKMGIPNYDLMKLDEYLFFKFNPSAQKSEFNHSEELKLEMNSLNFIFYGNNDEEPEIKVDEYGNKYI